MSTKYQLETIPVWDGIASQSECFICDLMQEAQKDSISFYLGSSVMNPETRVKVNTIGFCPQHTSMLVQSGSPNSMAVMWESHFEETRKQRSQDGSKTERGLGLARTRMPYLRPHGRKAEPLLLHNPLSLGAGHAVPRGLCKIQRFLSTSHGKDNGTCS